MTMPAFSVNTWTLDGLSFNTGPDANGFSYLVRTSDGWKGSPPRRPDLADRPDASGSFRGPNYASSRVVELDGVAIAPSASTRDQMADLLEGLCRNPNPLYDLVRNERGRSLRLGVEIQGRIDVRELPDGCAVAFNIQLVASDPRKFSTTVKSASTAIAQDPLDGMLWNGTPGNTGAEWNGPSAPITGTVWQASSGVSGVLPLDNDGNESTPVTFTITGPSSGTLVQPTITDTTNGNVLTYSGTLMPLDVLMIDTGTGNVTLNGSSGAGQMSRADFFEIPPHSTTVVQFSAAAPASTAQLTATWSDAY
jgi:hypothetical protein